MNKKDKGLRRGGFVAILSTLKKKSPKKFRVREIMN